MAGKDQALSRAGLLYPKAKRVRSPLFKRLPFFDPRDKLQVKYEMLRSHEVDGLSVTEAADQFAYTRQGFYQVQRAFEEEGMAGLIEKKRGRRGPVKCTPEVLKFVLGKKQADPELTGRDLTVLLREQQGVAVHRRTIEKIVSGFPPRPRKNTAESQMKHGGAMNRCCRFGRWGARSRAGTKPCEQRRWVKTLFKWTRPCARDLPARVSSPCFPVMRFETPDGCLRSESRGKELGRIHAPCTPWWRSTS